MSRSQDRQRPNSKEYDDYYHRYISLVPDGDIIEILEDQLNSSLELLSGIPGEKQDHRYAPGKWTIKELLGHIIDVEWLFTYRALQFARGDASPLSGMDQEAWMAGANFAGRSMESLVDELRRLRSANLTLFKSFDNTMLDRAGVASGCRFTVRSILYIVAGHQFHHIDILKSRYL